MASRYIELKDGITVEIGGPRERREEMSSAKLERVESTIDMLANVVEKIFRPIGDSLANMRKGLDTPIEIEKAEVEVGLSFSAEGGVFITKVSAEGSLTVKIIFAAVKSQKAPEPKP